MLLQDAFTLQESRRIHSIIAIVTLQIVHEQLPTLLFNQGMRHGLFNLPNGDFKHGMDTGGSVVSEPSQCRFVAEGTAFDVLYAQLARESVSVTRIDPAFGVQRFPSITLQSHHNDARIHEPMQTMMRFDFVDPPGDGRKGRARNQRETNEIQVGILAVYLSSQVCAFVAGWAGKRDDNRRFVPSMSWSCRM
jgi:hypothetical protein